MADTQDGSGGPTILVVDDDEGLRRMLTEHLAGMRCNVLEATDGDEGLQAAIEHHPDLLVLDVMMPGLTGWEVARYLRQRSEYDDVGIIMVTAIGETVNEMTSTLYGADERIDKPFKWPELDFKVRKILAQKRKQKREQVSHEGLESPAAS